MTIDKVINNLLRKAFEQGNTFYNFREELLQTLNITHIKDRNINKQLEHLFHTYLMTEYGKRHFDVMMENIDIRPYWMYVSVIDISTCEQCKKLNGKVFKYDDLFWRDYYPPNHIGCRCRVRALSPEDVSEKGLTIDKGENIVVSFDKNTLKSDLKKIKKAIKEHLKAYL